MNDHAPHEHTRDAPRVEDQALVTGAGRFIDDATASAQAFGCFVRSPHAFARIREIDTSAAAAMPGVLAIVTGADVKAAGVGSASKPPIMDGRNGSKLLVPFRPVLATDRVMHVGDCVALVVAETRLAAQDAAESVMVDYEEFEPAVDLATVGEEGAAQLFPEVPRNLVFDWTLPAEPDKLAEVDAIVAAAHRTASVRVVNQRILAATMETRGATASYDPQADRYTLRGSSQGANLIADQLCAVMGIGREKLRVFAEDVGGAFGMKAPGYPEYVALMLAARKTGRAVHWMSTRSESFLSDNQARDTITEATLALDAKGKFLALKVRHLASMGSYVTANGAFIQTSNFTRCFPAMYDIPKIGVEVECYVTNTVPTGPYRGAGRPEANYVMERVVEEAARVTGIDRVELRRRNLIAPAAIPYKTAVGTTFDSGDFAPVLEKALQLAGYDGFDKRRAESKSNGRLRGIGISCFLEHSGGMPTEGASVAFTGGEALTLGLGLGVSGQGHRTVFGRIAAQKLGIDPGRITVKQGDTALGVAGLASVASRGAMTVSNAVLNTIDIVLEKGKKAASLLLEASEQDIAFRRGAFEVVGTDRRMSLFEVADKAKDLVQSGVLAETLDTNAKVDTPQTFPNGCHIAEVEIDPESGEVAILNYAAVDDCGTVLNHMIVEGQVHGGVAQGLGQVLFENAVYDAGSGQLVSGSFMDYAMPRAHHMPPIRDGLHVVPATTNPLGVKGAGEGGTIGALAAIMNAIEDAIPGHPMIDMPATNEKIWRACRS
ncbi:MAG: xanthine dehydrogenase family protein molybdopterin-binding subunit [Rhizobiales bacterium]|nr:xanthine dehydrogenase family protein molybdopterin-binding subunit [Hyphomicrobiales bacterium]